MKRKCCSTCKHWYPLIGFYLGRCSDIPDSKAYNEDNSIHREDCTKSTDVCPDHIIKESWYG